jgi:hypothetical protein
VTRLVRISPKNALSSDDPRGGHHPRVGLCQVTLVPVIRGLVSEIDRTLSNYEKERNSR